MVDTAKCFSLIRGRAMRVTRLDGCGAAVLGPDSVVVTEGFITVGLTANTDEGTEISVQNAAGNTCILDTPAPKFTGYDVTVEFCGVDPQLFALMTGQSVVNNADTPALAVGFKMNSHVNADLSGFALEMWSNVPTAACAPGTGASYGYFLIPFLKGGVLGDFTVANDAINFTLSGANSKDGNGWGIGPYSVVPNATGVASKLLVALDPNDHLLLQLTTIAPPSTAVCGAQALGTLAASATAGIPGTWTPANSYGMLNIAATPIISPTPTTTWTTGQYIKFRDGSVGHWNGTAWVAGAKP